jgi:hypothetical protein
MYFLLINLPLGSLKVFLLVKVFPQFYFFDKFVYYLILVMGERFLISNFIMVDC